MYRCCLCGTEYPDAADAIKCVNRCGRSKFQDGAFIKKDSKYSGSTTSVKFSKELSVNFKEKDLEDEINKVCIKLIDGGAPEQSVNYIRKRIFNTWNEKSHGDKLIDLKRLLMTLKMYVRD